MKTTSLIAGLLFCFSCLGQGKFYGGNGDGFATASIINVVLPVQVINFNITEKQHSMDAVVSLAVSGETVCTIYLERSTDGSSFIAVDSMHADHPGLQGSTFQIKDVMPNPGLNYYRAKILRCSGAPIYTQTLLKKRNDSNPFRYLVSGRSLHYTTSKNGSLEIINSLGQVLQQNNIKAGTGFLTIQFTGTAICYLRFSGEGVGKLVVQ